MFRKEYLNQTSTHQHLWLLPKSWLLWKISALAFDFMNSLILKSIFFFHCPWSIYWKSFWKCNNIIIDSSDVFCYDLSAHFLFWQLVHTDHRDPSDMIGLNVVHYIDHTSLLLTNLANSCFSSAIRIGVWYSDYLNFLASSTQEVNICFGSFQVDEIFERCLFSFCFFWKSSFLSLLGKDFLVRVMQRAVWQDFRH